MFSMAIIYELTKEQKTILNPETHATLATRHRTHLSKTQPQKITTKKTKKDKPPKPGMNQSARFT